MQLTNGERPINIKYQISHWALSFKKQFLNCKTLKWIAQKNTYV